MINDEGGKSIERTKEVPLVGLDKSEYIGGISAISREKRVLRGG